MVGLRLVGRLPVALGERLSNQRTERTFRLPFGRRPVEAILLALAAQDPLRVLGTLPVAVDLGVLALRIDVGLEHFHGAQLIRTNTAVEDFLDAGRGIEPPLSGILHDRWRKRKILLAYVEDRGAVIRLTNFMSRIVGVHETLACRGVSDIVAGAYDRLRILSEHGHDVLDVAGSDRGHKRVRCFLR